jgi:hypothetical protein
MPYTNTSVPCILLDNNESRQNVSVVYANVKTAEQSRNCPSVRANLPVRANLLVRALVFSLNESYLCGHKTTRRCNNYISHRFPLIVSVWRPWSGTKPFQLSCGFFIFTILMCTRSGGQHRKCASGI